MSPKVKAVVLISSIVVTVSILIWKEKEEKLPYIHTHTLQKVTSASSLLDG